MVEVEINLFEKLKAENYSTQVFFSEFEKIQDWVDKNCNGIVSILDKHSGEWSEIFILYFDEPKDAMMFKLWWQ